MAKTIITSILVLAGLIAAVWIADIVRDTVQIRTSSGPSATAGPPLQDAANLPPTVTTIIRESQPAKIEIITPPAGDPYEMASYSAIVDTNQVVAAINVNYDEASNLFDIKADIINRRESVVIAPPAKKRTVRLTGQIGIGFNQDEKTAEHRLSRADIAIGALFADRYSVLAFVDTDLTYGIRLGVNF